MASQWPPRSPHEALLGTPSGRERLRRLAERKSPTPSPSKLRASRSASALGSNYALEDQLLDEDGDEDDEDDEETLQLKLQAIEARLKLKKLKATKAQKKAATASLDGGNNGLRPLSAPGDAGGLRELPIQSKLAAARDRMERQTSQTTVQVPASPIRRAQNTANLQTSPQRVVLGIDKGLRAADVSLKRVPSLRRSQEERAGQQGGYLRRTKTPLPDQAREAEAPRPISFNERLASARSEEASRQERQQRIQKLRSAAFSVGKQEMEEYKTKALDIPEEPYKPQEYTRNEILSATGGSTQRSNTASGVRTTVRLDAESPEDPLATANSTTLPEKPESEAAFEAFSGLHLSKRILPHKVLTRAITGMKTYLLKDLLRHVKAPDWSLPDVESDIVVFAIIASKSDPRSHRPGPGGEGKHQKDRGKYMVITLVDLAFEVELFLFNSGFDRFWKLTPGTVLAILNPSIIPPPPGREATGRFGLVINSDADTILEIGSARDLGYCRSLKKDGQLCSSWINVRRTEYCEFHTNEALRKSRASRIEFNNTSAFDGGGEGPRSRRHARHVPEKSEAERKRSNYDRTAHSHFFVSGAHRAADLLDDEHENGMADRAEREEALKRRLLRQERERDIAKRLSELGGGAGKEYMSRAASRAATATTATSAGLGLRSSVSSSSSTVASAAVSGSLSSRITNTSLSTLGSSGDMHNPPRWDARALGLVGKRGEPTPKISLGPVKRKRPESSSSASTAGLSISGGGGSNKGATALGWGSSLKDKLARMKEGERLDGRKGFSFASATAKGDDGGGSMSELPMPPPRDGDTSPVRKKTRFITEKGIREAGRESLGEPLSAAAKSRRQVVFDDDDDDDLVIVK